jgi:isobutyryl-CoA mutase
VRFESRLPRPAGRTSSSKTIIIPPERVRYLSEIAETLRRYHQVTRSQMDALRSAWHLSETARSLEAKALEAEAPELLVRLKAEAVSAWEAVDPATRARLDEWKELKETYGGDELVYSVRGREIRQPLYSTSLARSRIPRIVLPRFEDPAEIYRWMREENVPGRFPFTAGVFPLKRADEDPTRMFAGEGDPARTNRRFKLLSANYEAKRFRPPSTRSPSTGSTPRSARTSTARWAPRASASARWTTSRCSTAASSCAPPTPRSR